MDERLFNIIRRAEEDYDYEYDIEDPLIDIAHGAENAILNADKPDYIEECECNKHYNHISWNDGMEFSIESSGDFISTDDSKNRYYRRDEFGDYYEINWYDHNENDYVLMDKVIDTNGNLVYLVAK